MASFFVKKGPYLVLESEEATVKFERLPVGTYVVQFNPMAGFYLEPIEVSALPEKIYGTHRQDAKRILNTFLDRPRSTGVLLSGEKGSGKTMLTRLISHEAAERGMPTLVINTPYTGDNFNTFLSEISQPCVVLFDEFEKVYDKDSQPGLLTLMDGVVKSQKLYLLTTNDKWAISFFMRNRPGRLFYMLEYTGLSTDFVREYCQDNLKNKSQIESVVTVTHLFSEFNFDMLQALVEEMNRYGETVSEALRLLNVKPDTTTREEYEMFLVDPTGQDVDMGEDNIWPRNPMLAPLHHTFGIGEKDEDGDFSSYKTVRFTPEQIIQVTPNEGKIKLRNQEGFTITLVKVKPKPFDMGVAYRAAELGAGGLAL
jgi:hypothetical protein